MAVGFGGKGWPGGGGVDPGFVSESGLLPAGTLGSWALEKTWVAAFFPASLPAGVGLF